MTAHRRTDTTAINTQALALARRHAEAWTGQGMALSVALFGSQARGDAAPGSPVDLAAIVPDRHARARLTAQLHGPEWRHGTGPATCAIIITPEELKREADPLNALGGLIADGVIVAGDSSALDGIGMPEVTEDSHRYELFRVQRSQSLPIAPPAAGLSPDPEERIGVVARLALCAGIGYSRWSNAASSSGSASGQLSPCTFARMRYSLTVDGDAFTLREIAGMPNPAS